ncbi:MAG: hypothetical protein AAF228_06050 [Pseudomonadota bacterium]
MQYYDKSTDCFDGIWITLAQNYKCDKIDTEPYVEIKNKWFDADKPDDIEAFILEQATLEFIGCFYDLSLRFYRAAYYRPLTIDF